MYDITNRESFTNLSHWIEMTELEMSTSTYPTDKYSKLLVGNKCDLVTKREVPTDEAWRFAYVHDMTYMEVSAKKDINIAFMFKSIAQQLAIDKIPNKRSWGNV